MIAPPHSSLHGRFADLLSRAGVSDCIIDVTECSRGGNNRIHRVTTPSGVFAVKEYFRHADDPRDRLSAETAFLIYASLAAPGMTPRFYGADAAAGLALYEFIDGTRLDPAGVTPLHVDAAIEFFRCLNAVTARGHSYLPVASEAAFSVEQHLDLVEGRISRLGALTGESDADLAAKTLVRRLREIWDGLASTVRDAARREGLAGTLRDEERCISPSDFGFHNALVTQAGELRFIDFEYAGWDDPAKTAGDFFAQPAVPVPAHLFEQFVERAFELLPNSETAVRRAALLRPVYVVKWCCIALNVFVPVHLARRQFANPTLDESSLKQSQLATAEQLLDRLPA